MVELTMTEVQSGNNIGEVDALIAPAAGQPSTQLQRTEAPAVAADGSSNEPHARVLKPKRVAELEAEQHELHRQLKDKQKKNEVLLLHLHRLQKEMEGYFLESQELRGKIGPEAKQREPHRQFGDAQKKNEVLLLHLHCLQKEMEGYFLESQKLRRKARRLEATGPLRALDVQEIERGQICEEPPYRHVDFQLRSVFQNHQRLAVLDLRVVEHHGVPGLVVFDTLESGSPPLSCWVASGQENGRSFMLLHPQHKTARALFAELTTSDWLLLNDAVALAHMALRDQTHGRGVSPRWKLVCLRLREQFARFSRMLRYDRASIINLTREARKAHLDIELHNVTFGQRAYPNLRLRWSLGRGQGVRGGPATSLTFVAPEADGLPPFSSWPITEEGAYEREVTLHFGKGCSRSSRNAQWNALDREDRDFVAALVDGLAPVLTRSEQVELPRGFDLADITRLVELIMREITGVPSKSKPPWEREPV